MYTRVHVFSNCFRIEVTACWGWIRLATSPFKLLRRPSVWWGQTCCPLCWLLRTALESHRSFPFVLYNPLDFFFLFLDDSPTFCAPGAVKSMSAHHAPLMLEGRG